MRSSAQPREPFFRNIARKYEQISYDEFVQRVKRHRPSELLPAIAQAAIDMRERDVWMRSGLVTPWALGVVTTDVADSPGPPVS